MARPEIKPDTGGVSQQNVETGLNEMIVIGQGLAYTLFLHDKE